MKRYSIAAIVVISLLLLFAITRLNSNPVTHMFEFHFQEGFDGELIEVSGIDDEPITFTAQSKFTTGLAHIIELSETQGTQVSINIDDLKLEYTVMLDVNSPFVTISMSDGVLEINQTDVRPGYL